MSRAAWLLVMLASATAAATPVAMPRPTLPLPELALPDPGEDVRWPLSPTQHPALEPAFPLGETVPWTELCARGAQYRRVAGAAAERQDYLRAWCAVAAHDEPAAIALLAPLLRSPTPKLATAVRLDIADILVELGGADQAARALAAAKLHDVGVYDLLAAAYAEVGKTADANAFNDRALAAMDVKRSADHCHRLERRVLLAPAADQPSLIDALAPLQGEATCRTLLGGLRCWRNSDCDLIAGELPISAAARSLVVVYARWPAGPRGAGAWGDIVRRISVLGPQQGADALLVAGVEAWMRALDCTGDDLHTARAYAWDVKQTWPAHDKALDARIDRIVERPTEVCR